MNEHQAHNLVTRHGQRPIRSPSEYEREMEEAMSDSTQQQEALENVIS